MSIASRIRATSAPLLLISLSFPTGAMLGQSLPSTPAALTTSAAAQGGTTAPIAITLDEAIRRAQMNEPAYRAALGDARIAGLDRSIARATLLPSAVAHNQFLYTQPNGLHNFGGQTTTPAGAVAQSTVPQVFIANNSVHEYTSQILVNETVGLAQVADAKRAAALAAQAAAQQEIARRGLIATVVDLYFSASSSGQKLALARRALDEANSFSQLTVKLENGREVAHADVLKGQLQAQQRQRDLGDAILAEEKSRLDLAVLLFPDPTTAYLLSDENSTPPPVPAMDAIETAARQNNPDLGEALAAVAAADQEVLASRAAYLPDLALNVTYGIDAPQFAKNGSDGTRNLGYSAFVTVDIPIWDWFSTQHRVQQSEIRRDNTKLVLTFAQKRLITQLHEYFNEASVANQSLASLQTSATAATESLRLTKLRYSAGEATVLEVVDAQNTKITVDAALADGATRYRVALANLQTLTGAL